MFRIIDKRGSGKTARLMLLAKEYNGIIVCGNPDAFAYKAKAYGFNDLRFISYSDYMLRPYDYRDETIFIDEVDGLMKALPGKVQGYCLTPDD